MLIELLFAVLIMAIVVGALAVASNGVQLASEYGQGYGLATQHARVALDRIDRAVNEAFGNLTYPGVWVTQDVDGAWNFPDTLVIWHPAGAPANAAGPPLMQELMIFCPDPAALNNLVLLTAPGNISQVPTTNAASFKSMIDTLKTSASANKVVLTNLLRVALESNTSTGIVYQRGAVRFVVTLTPSASNWSSYTSGTTTWSNLPWPQGLFGSSKGVRQVWLRSEMQLMPGVTWVAGNSAGAGAIPFLGSAVFYYGIP
jgi:hypothetical protein